jgi:hypothetical protein
MDRAIDASAAKEGSVRGVDNGVDPKRGDVGDHNIETRRLGKSEHTLSSAVHQLIAFIPLPSGKRLTEKMAPWRHRGRPVVVRVARHFMGGHGLPRDGTAIILSGRVLQSGEGNDDKSKGRPQRAPRRAVLAAATDDVPAFINGKEKSSACSVWMSTRTRLVARRAASFIELPNLLGAPSRCADFYTVWPSADRWCRETGRRLFGSLLLLFPARIDCSEHLRRRHRQFG